MYTVSPLLRFDRISYSYRSGRRSPLSRISLTRSRYWFSSWLIDFEPLEDFSSAVFCESVILLVVLLIGSEFGVFGVMANR